jgi:hypothetical protein
MKTHIIALAALTLISTLHAQTATPAGTASVRTVGDAIALSQALSQLDGQKKIVDHGKDIPAEVVVVPYEFSGPVRFALADDLAALQVPLKAFDDAKQALAKQYPSDSNGKLSEKFLVEANAALAQPVDLKLKQIKRADLQLDRNPIPLSVLAALSPVLVD